MTAYLRRSCLSSGGLSLTLRNEDGQLQDAENVRWTVSSAHDGRRASGIGMRAIRRGVGSYYAPWYADDPTGAFEILWEFQRNSSLPVERSVERFFVMDLDNPTDQAGHIRNLPPPGGHVFEYGTRIGDRDLVLRLSSANGVPASGHMVMWQIEYTNGCVLVPWQSAKILAVGEYCVEWVVSASGGQYALRWQWSEGTGCPLEEALDTFQVVNPRCPKQGVQTVGWKPVSDS